MPGDRIFLGKQGIEPKGIIGSGIATSTVFNKQHWEDQNKETTYIWIDFDTLLYPEQVLPRTDLGSGSTGAFYWDTPKSGNTIPDDTAVQLEQLWRGHL